MAKKNTGGLKYEDFKKSLEDLSKNLSGDQLEKANATLKKVEESLIAQKEISGVEKITLTNIEKSLGKEGKVNKTLGDIKKSLSKDGDLYKSQAKQAEKLFSLIQKQYKPLKDVKDEKPVTVKEGLKSLVGGAKSIGSRIKGTFQSVKNDPLGSLKNAAGKAERKIANAFDTAYNAGEEVLATDKDFTVKRGRFAQEGVKAGKFKTEEEGIKAAKRLERREAVSEGRKNQLAESEKYGFVNEGLRDKLSKSQERKIQDDPRLKPLAKVETATVQSTPSTTAKVEKGSTEGKPLTDFGEVGAKREMARVETKPDDQAKKEKEIEAANLAKNPESDNVRDSQEIIADNSKEDLQLSKDLLETTKEQLTELRAIKEALSAQTRPTESKKEPDNAAQVAPVAQEGGSVIGDIANAAGDLMGGRPGPKGPSGGTISTGGGKVPGKPSMGGRILGGLGKAAKFLGPAAAIAGTAYAGYEGYQNTASNFDLQEGQQATTGQKISSTLGGVASGLTFGLADEKSVAQGIHGIGSAIGDFFTGGDKSKDTPELPNSINAPSTGASGFPLKSEAKPAETAAEDIQAPARITRTTASNNADPADPKVRAQIEAEQKSYTETPEGRAKFAKMMSGAETFAKGGQVEGGGAENGADYIVGEEGPELFVPFKDGVVIPNDVSKKIAPAAIKGGLKGLANGGIALNDDGSYNKGNRTYSPSINGFQRSVSNTGAETTTADVGLVSVTREKDIYGNERGVSATVPLSSDMTLETGKLQAGSTLQYAKATGRDASGREHNLPTGDILSELSDSNNSMRDEMSAKGGSSQPIIMNNSSNNTKNNFMPMKTDPRPSSRGSALDKYLESTSSY